MKQFSLWFVLCLMSTGLFAQQVEVINLPQQGYFEPLDTVMVRLSGNIKKGQIQVLDAKDQVYFSQKAVAEFGFLVTGMPGYHRIVLSDKKGQYCKTGATFKVDCQTKISTDSEHWNVLFDYLKWNIFKPKEAKIVRYKTQPYFLFSDWLRDHVNILKGKKYFFADVKDGIDLFAETQLDNGMVFDFYMPLTPSLWEDRFDNKDFIKPLPEEGHYLQRVPCENDVEFWFVTGLYHSWRATNDHEWMEKWLPAAERALKYNMTSPYCWSEQYKLIKRPFTIDTWDFMPRVDAAKVGGDVMESIPGKSYYGIMHGDNTGFAYACQCLAEMYQHTDQTDKAKHWLNVKQDVLDQLYKTSWNGQFFTHFVDETPKLERDLGVDLSKQVSLSNTFALNRPIDHDKAVEIIKTYQRIQNEMPETAPGEFFGIYPPFEKGFHMQPWHYTNGGVFPFIAGELAKGAFEHGYESYGIDILTRVKNLLDENDGEFPYYWIGKIPERPETQFTSIPLKQQANTDIAGQGADGVPGWTGEGTSNDLSKLPTGRYTFEGVPFDIIDPAQNGHRACVGLSKQEPYAQELTIPVNKKCQSMYILHTMAGGGMAGWMTITYNDGSVHREYIKSGKQLRNWWNPSYLPYHRSHGWTSKVAWSGHNGRAEVGVYAWCYDNPQPDKVIDKLTFTHSQTGNKWFIFAITLSDQAAYFPWPQHTGDWLVNWNSGCLMNAMLEGLAGVSDAGVSFDTVKIAPRWSLTEVEQAKVTVKYPASGNYAAYQLKKLGIKDADLWELKLAGVAQKTYLRIPLPDKGGEFFWLIDGESVKPEFISVEDTKYAVLSIDGHKVHRLIFGIR